VSESNLSTKLPLKQGITRVWNLSIILAIFLGVMSLIGLIFRDSIYTSEEQIRAFLANDIINLIVEVPILLVSMWLTRGGKLVGLLLWPGALLYVLYNYITYVVGLPFGTITLIYLALVLLSAFLIFDLMRVLLSAFLIFDLMRRIDLHLVKERLAGAVWERISGWILVLFGALFLFRAIAIIVEAFMNQTALPISEIGLLIADLALSVVWILGGILLLKRTPLGYASGLGLLFLGSMLFVGLALILLLQPLLITDAQFASVDVIVVLIMGSICFIPFGLFLRGVLSVGYPSQNN
jgi:hypothetical protein